ncbi:hypothetical protein TNCV_1731141 [Trichonephila clavipes]|nr:hypothetical protein TNCV_1731141 [Trichonephila clavipes]
MMSSHSAFGEDYTKHKDVPLSYHRLTCPDWSLFGHSLRNSILRHTYWLTTQALCNRALSFINMTSEPMLTKYGQIHGSGLHPDKKQLSLNQGKKRREIVRPPTHIFAQTKALASL